MWTTLVRAAAVAGVSTLALSVVASGQDNAEKAERLMNANCSSCHDLRPIQTAAKSRAEWTATITTMIEKGAKLPKEEMPLLADHLTRTHGPVPDGPGKRVLLNTCTMCHDLGRIKVGRRTSEEWEETLIAMLNEGAPLNDEDFALVHHYLSENFNVE
jgi:mono/diheme cytochrome c family protein